MDAATSAALVGRRHARLGRHDSAEHYLEAPQLGMFYAAFVSVRPARRRSQIAVAPLASTTAAIVLVLWPLYT
jgi:hypothetical protein